MGKTPPVNINKNAQKTIPKLSAAEKLKIKLAEKYYGHEEVTDEEIRFYEKLLAEME